MRRDRLYWKGGDAALNVTFEDYFDLPYEIEAYGREKGLLAMFLIKWKAIEEELGIIY